MCSSDLFAEASRAVVKGPYDLSLVEGSITTPHDAERIHQVRRASKRLVTIGACATAGGIQALRNFKDVKEFTSIVYATPAYIDTLQKSTPISEHVALVETRAHVFLAEVGYIQHAGDCSGRTRWLKAIAADGPSSSALAAASHACGDGKCSSAARNRHRLSAGFRVGPARQPFCSRNSSLA